MNYEQFETEAKKEGLWEQFSEADRSLAKENPTAGMEILKYKLDARNATTSEQLALANQGAEGVRNQYGYAGGTDGSGYYKTSETPRYTNNYAGYISDLWGKQKNYGDFSYDVEKPTYESQYEGEMQGLLSDILNRKEFSYDAESDPLYSQYKKHYLREGERASADALGIAAAATGGIPSSYAATAAAQAGNYYAAQLTDKIPELYQAEYNKYLNEQQLKRSDLDAIMAMDNMDYNRYQDDVTRWTEDRNFAYNQHQDGYNKIATDLKTAAALENADYGKYVDDVNFRQKEKETALLEAIQRWEMDYSERKLANDISNTDWEKDFSERKLANDISNTDWEKDYAERKLANDISNTDWEKDYAERKLANDISNTGWERGIAERRLTNDISNTEYERLYNIAILQAEAGNMNLLNLLGQKLTGENWNTLDSSAFLTNNSRGSYGGNPGGSGGYGGDPTVFSYTGDIFVANPTGYIGQEDWDALAEVYGEKQLTEAGLTKGVAPYSTYNEAVQYLKDNGKADKAGYISPRSEWEKHKGGYITYEKYLEAKIKNIMGE